MPESIYKNNELENEVSLDMSYFWHSDVSAFFCIISPTLKWNMIIVPLHKDHQVFKIAFLLPSCQYHELHTPASHQDS